MLRQPLRTALAAPDEAFGWLVGAGERFRAGDRSVAPEFFIEHAQVLADVARYLPRARDRSMDGYACRVTHMIGGRRFGLVIDDFQAQAPELWLRLREFLRGLYAVTGIPGEHAKATLFLGNYRSTPFGLHRGRSGNFMFVVHGRKHIRAWPDRFFRGKEDMTNRLDYGRYNGASTVLSAAPGDVIYWPSDYWHIGEDAGGLSVAISLALFMAPDVAGDLARNVERLVRARDDGRRRTGPFPLHPGGRRASATVGAAARQTARRLTTVSRDVEEALTGAWLNHLTGYGFASVPAPEPLRPLAARTVIRGCPQDPIRVVTTRDGALVCSANGHAFSVTGHPKLSALLEQLNSGRPCRVGELMTTYSGRASRAGIRAILEKLYSLRAVSDGRA